MRSYINATAFTLAISILIPCSHAAESQPPAHDDDTAVAQTAAVELITTLKNELTAAMQKGGPVAAIEICSARAQTLTARIPARVGRPDLRIKRTSLKYRNPANKPTDEEALVLQRFVGQLREGKALEPLMEHTENELRYYQPLQVAPLCLSCHGMPEEIPPEVHTLLQRYYPGDRATGFAAGDLRGMISITVPAGSQ